MPILTSGDVAMPHSYLPCLLACATAHYTSSTACLHALPFRDWRRGSVVVEDWGTGWEGLQRRRGGGSEASLWELLAALLLPSGGAYKHTLSVYHKFTWLKAMSFVFGSRLLLCPTANLACLCLACAALLLIGLVHYSVLGSA